jgi:hypothetical protein
MRRPLATLSCLLAILALRPAPAMAEPDPTQLCRAAIARAERDAGIPSGLLQAIGQVESGRRNPETGTRGPWPWTLNAEGRGQFFPHREAALAAVRELQARGVRIIDVGCMQVNLHHHPRAFATLEDAFDPTSNARYAARFLGELFTARPDWMTAAGHYHSHTPELAEAYRGRVRTAWSGTQAREAEDRLLAQAPVPQPSARATPVIASLSNGAERAQVLTLPGGAGRGLDAYRANPVPLTGRAYAIALGSAGRR